MSCDLEECKQTDASTIFIGVDYFFCFVAEVHVLMRINKVQKSLHFLTISRNNVVFLLLADVWFSGSRSPWIIYI